MSTLRPCYNAAWLDRQSTRFLRSRVNDGLAYSSPHKITAQTIIPKTVPIITPLAAASLLLSSRRPRSIPCYLPHGWNIGYRERSGRCLSGVVRTVPSQKQTALEPKDSGIKFPDHRPLIKNMSPTVANPFPVHSIRNSWIAASTIDQLAV